LHTERAAPTCDKESVRGQSLAAQCIPFATRLIFSGMTLPMIERLFATRRFKARSFTLNCAKDSNEAAIFAGEAEAGSGYLRLIQIAFKKQGHRSAGKMMLGAGH
jgi:hypothetical protein